MGSLERRVEVLEARRSGLAPAKAAPRDEEQVKRDWLLRAESRRREELGPRARHVRELLRLFNMQHILARMSMEETIDRILLWSSPPEGLTRNFVEREVALAIYRQHEGTENMVCPPYWRESFVAGDEILERHLSATDEEWVEAARATEKFIRTKDYARWFGITKELFIRAMGPDVKEITLEEVARRYHDYAGDALYGEKCYRVRKLLRSG